jgi:hypothetical protein
MSTALDRDALYYPYIHIRDVNWLKATLLCFPQLRRILPDDFDPEDSFDVSRFARIKNARGEPLLSNEYTGASSTWSPVQEAQNRLLVVLRQNEELIKEIYEPMSFDFDMHTGKVMNELEEYLIESDLAP